MADTNDKGTPTPQEEAQKVAEATEQTQSGINDVINNAGKLYNNVRHLPQTLATGLAEAYTERATTYRQNLTADTTNVTTTNQQTQTVTRISAQDAKTAAPQMFDDFINKNYTEEQQTAIRTEMSTQLATNNGTCTFIWKDKEERDSVTAVYEENQLKNFKLYNEDVTADNYQSQELRFHMKKDNEDAFTLISETKDKAQTTIGKVTHKTKDKVKVKDDGSYVSRSSDSDKIVSTDLGQISISATKQTAKEKGDADGVSQTKQTTSQYNVEVGVFAVGASARGATQTTTFDDNGNVTRQTAAANGISVSTKGVDIAHQDKQTVYNDDGSSVTTQNELRAALHSQDLAARAQIAHQRTVTGANGEVISDTQMAVSATVGYGAVGGSIETQTLRTKEDGSTVAHHNALGAEVSRTGASAYMAQENKIVNNNGVTTYESSTQASFTADRTGGTFNASTLKDVRDGEGNTVLHKELSAQAMMSTTNGTMNLNLASDIQTETRTAQTSFNARVDSNTKTLDVSSDKLITQTDENGQINTTTKHLSAGLNGTDKNANFQSITTTNGQEEKRISASADINKAELAYNDKKLSPEQLMLMQMQSQH